VSTSITVAGIGGTTISIADGAREQRDDILSQLRDVTAVSDAFDADTAASALKIATVFLRSIEAGRTEAKAPVLALGKQIEAIGKELAADVEAEAGRLSRLLGDYQKEEKRKAEAAERLARDEARRIQDDAERRAREAVKAAASEDEALSAATEIMDTAAAKIVEAKQAIVSTVAPKAAGTAVRENVCFEVSDIAALYAARPELVTLEPNGAAIRAICKANPKLQLPGLRHWTEAKTFIR
jgi:hypothetical protein